MCQLGCVPHNKTMTTTTPLNGTTVREMWRTRPVRIPSDQGGKGKISGVCEGIGARYGIDPVIVRVLFVVAALGGGGAGIALYLACWLCMPRYSLNVSPLEALLSGSKDQRLSGERKRAIPLAIGVLVFAGALGGSLGPVTIAPGLVTYILFFFIWYFLYSRQPEAPAGLLVDVAEKPAQQPAPYLSTLEPVAGFESPYSAQNPPAWDPLGVAPFAWDLPEPGPKPEPKPKQKSWVKPLVISAVVIAAVPAVAAIGMVTASLLDPAQREQMGDIKYTVTKESDLKPLYDGGMGNMTINLTDLEPLTKDTEVDISGGMGNVEVLLPHNVPVNVNCNSGLGKVDCTSGHTNKDAKGKTLTLDVDGGLGNVTVKEQP